MTSIFSRKMRLGILLIIFFPAKILFTFLGLGSATDSITPNLPLTNPQKLISPAQSFELGFFLGGGSNGSYLGIWYKNTPNAVVWVANRDKPISGPAGTLALSGSGDLILLDGRNITIWTSNTSGTVKDPILQLLDSGNLVVRDRGDTDPMFYLWQSFDILSDTLLPGMKVLWSSTPGQDRYLTSWKSSTDPSPGGLTYRIENHGMPQFVLQNGLKKLFRTGPWNGVHFSGVPMSSNPVFRNTFVYGSSESYYMFETNGDSVTTRLTLDRSGLVQRLVLNKEEGNGWQLMYKEPNDMCDEYGQCGPNGICRINGSPICDCLPGFTPKSLGDWEVLNWVDGCVSRVNSSCREGEDFVKLAGVKLPDFLNFSINKTMGLKQCRTECLKNCSCSAYTNLNISSGSGCLMWFGDLVDIKELIIKNDSKQDLHIRIAASELELLRVSKKRKRIVILAVVLAFSGTFIFSFAAWFLIWKKKSKEGHKVMEDLELPMFDLSTISTATRNFSSTNVLGEGGFGTVYKGELSTGQLIAVKRLSRDSGQGLEELKNEVILIAKLQHRNLVRLLGCCIEGEERILVYEYMLNRSLDNFIFDNEARSVLNWQKRFDIIMGIARGLLYLHQDSRLNIIHRDLKTSNILLDAELNPKISDFGIARTFVGEQNETRTKRVVGTYGYMSPEYAIHGKFSVKSDVFSLGVLLLEIVSGKRNTGFSHPDHHHCLLGHAWLLWSEGRGLELADEAAEVSSAEKSQVLRCIQVGLLCVQNLPDDRPLMSSVLFMLGNEGTALPRPRQPGFFYAETCPAPSSPIKEAKQTENALTITVIEAR